MVVYAKTTAHRPKPLDLVRRAKILGCTPGHLSMVLSGKRQSLSLMLRLKKLLESEAQAEKRNQS